MTSFPPPSPPYLGPAKFHGGAQAINPLRRIVIHCTVSPCQAGGARAIASYFAHTVTRPSSAHYVVDPGEVVQVVGDHQVAYHAPPNTDTLGVELCDPQTGPASRWSDVAHAAMLARAAELVAELCLAYGLPVRRVGAVQLRLGLRGITGHRAVADAWHQTTHTDPGEGFPWGTFMSLVQAAVAERKAAAKPKPVKAKPTPAKPTPAKPTPAPKPTPKPAPAPIPPTRAAGGTGMWLVTSNIKNLPDLTREQVRHDMGAVRKLGGVICWQEIAEADDVADLKATLPDYVHHHTDTECPISVLASRWDAIDSGTLELHGGKAAVSPHRVATWVVLRRQGSKVPAVAVINTHFVSGAYSHPGQLAEDWRVAMWNQAHDKLAGLVQAFLAKGITCVGGGDFNRTGTWPGFAPGQVWLIHGGFDHLWAAEATGGAKVVAESTGTLPVADLFTDHDARWAHLYLQGA